MMIVLDCPGCGKRYEVDASLAGKKSRCKDCGHIFRIPAPQSVPAIRAEIISVEPAAIPAPADRAETITAKPAAIPAPAIVPLGVDRGTIVLNCPRCLKRYEVYASLAGKKSRCKDCKEVFTIPAPMGRPAKSPAERPAQPKAPKLGQTYWDEDPDDAQPPYASNLPVLSNFEDEPLASLPPRATYPERVGQSSRRENVDTEVGVTVAGWYCALSVLGCIFLAIWRGVSEPGFPELTRAVGWSFAILTVTGCVIGWWGNIWLFVIAFRDKVERGVFCLLIPFYFLYYIFSRWRELRGIFALSVAPIVMILGFMIFGATVLRVSRGGATIGGAIGDGLENVLPESAAPEANLQEVKVAAQLIRDYIQAIDRVTKELSEIRQTGLEANAPGGRRRSAMALRNSVMQLRFAQDSARSLGLGKNEQVALKHALGEKLRTALSGLKNEMGRIESLPGMQGTFADAPRLIDAELAFWTLQPGEEVRPTLVDRPKAPSTGPAPDLGVRRPAPGAARPGRGFAMPSLEEHYASLRSQHGEKAVLLVLTGLPLNSDPAAGVTNRDVSAAIDKRLKELAPGAHQSMSTASGGGRSICIAPVDDLPGLVRGIDFGKATERGSRIEVALSEEYVASVPPLAAEPSIAAQHPRPRPTEAEIPAGADPLTKWMIQLKSPEVHQQKAAITRIRRITPDDRLEVVVVALLPLLDQEDQFLVRDVIQTLEVWRSPQAVPKLIERANDDRFMIRKQAIKTLGKYKDPRAAEPIAAHLKEDHFEAEEALKALGSAAEPALIERLKDSDPDIRRRACDILKQVGGMATLKAMKALPADPEFSVRIAATEAMKQIIQRVGPLKESPSARKSGKR